MAVAAVNVKPFPATFVEQPRIRFSLVCCRLSCNKFTRKKNHLRPKILKTLNPRSRPEEIPIPVVDDDPLTDSVPVAPPEVHSALERENGGSVVVEGESLQSMEGFRNEVRDEGGFFGEFTVKDVVKFGFWFVGWFVFQTACAVWVLGWSRLKDGVDDEDSKEVVQSVDLREKGEAFILSGMLNKVGSAVGVVDVEKRIEEIRSMAQEARRIEKSGLQGSEDDGEVEGDGDEDESGSVRTDIEKEIDARLEKLRKQFKSVQKPVASSSTGSGRVKGVIGLESGLMFERKLKFRNPPLVEESSRPKGFDGAEFRCKAQKKKRSSATVVNAIGSDGRMKASEKIISTHTNAREGEMVSYGQVKSEFGDASKSGKLENLQKSSQVRAKISGDLQSAAMDIPSGNSKRMAVARNVEGNQLVDAEADDQWWLSLPCVFAMLMKRGPDSEDQRGLFTLKIFSEDDSDYDTDDEDEDNGLSYVIGFEHRYDANNFCYLLESFFEDLGDFAADIVTLSKIDLLEMVREQMMKIFVVRKGQLQLYVGQPFREVEATLKSLIQGNQR